MKAFQERWTQDVLHKSVLCIGTIKYLEYSKIKAITKAFTA